MPTPIIPPHSLPTVLYAQDGTPMQWDGVDQWTDSNNDNYVDYVDNGTYVSDPILEGKQLLGRMVLREYIPGDEGGYYWNELVIINYQLTLIGSTWTLVGNSPDTGYEDKRAGAELDEEGEPVVVDGTMGDLSTNHPDFFKPNIIDYWLGKGSGSGYGNSGAPLKGDTEWGADLRPSQEPPISDWTIATS